MRRRQRVDAAARMVNHIMTVVVWICVTIASFQILDIDAAFFTCSVGFIGAGLAIGGQHKVNDYVTGAGGAVRGPLRRRRRARHRRPPTSISPAPAR